MILIIDFWKKTDINITYFNHLIKIMKRLPHSMHSKSHMFIFTCRLTYHIWIFGMKLTMKISPMCYEKFQWLKFLIFSFLLGYLLTQFAQIYKRHMLCNSWCWHNLKTFFLIKNLKHFLHHITIQGLSYIYLPPPPLKKKRNLYIHIYCLWAAIMTQLKK